MTSEEWNSIKEYEPKTVTIDIERYDELISAECMLEALERAGVDNWEGYELALDDIDET